MSAQHDPAIEHYRDGSANPAWLRACREIEADCDFAPDAAPVLQPIPVQEAA